MQDKSLEYRFRCFSGQNSLKELRIDHEGSPNVSFWNFGGLVECLVKLKLTATPGPNGSLPYIYQLKVEAQVDIDSDAKILKRFNIEEEATQARERRRTSI